MEHPPDRTPPVDAAAVLAWMAARGDRLAELTAAQAGHSEPVRHAADDGAIRAGLCFVAEALAATADPSFAPRLAGFPEGIDAWFDQEIDELEAQLARAEGAIALTQLLQFGTTPGRDPSLDAGLERRMRLTAWLRLFLLGLEAHLGPAHDGLADAALTWMADHQRELGRLILAMGGRARASLQDAANAPLDAETLDEIGQMAVVRAHIRQLVEALGATLEDPAAV